jgi:hypothetical protein
MSKRFRHSARFADTRRCFRPLDRNAKARLLYLAEAIEHRTKGKGCRQGAWAISASRCCERSS